MMEMRLVTAAMEGMSTLQKTGIYDRYVDRAAIWAGMLI